MTAPTFVPSKTGQEPKRLRGLGRKTHALRAAVLAIVEGFEGPMSARQIFYQCVSRGVVPNNKVGLRRVLRQVLAMRRDRSIAYTKVVDRTRAKHHREGWNGVSELMDTFAVQYRRDLWASQNTVVMICCEKQALEGVFSEVVDQYGASLWVIRGFNSESFEYEWSEEIKEITNAGRHVVIAYFGDHDPSGLALEHDARSRLEGFGAAFSWERHGLLFEDFDRFDLVNVDVKKGDTRAKAYLSRFGNRAAELDALPPEELDHRIRAAIENHIDVGPWNRLRDREKAERESLVTVRGNWDVALAAARGGA
jgi:hypothetical protein